MSLLKISNLRVQFKNNHSSAEAVSGISFAVEPGECIGLVGESGSGKSTAMQAIMGLLPDQAEVNWQERYLAAEASIAMIFQDPNAYLNPSLKVGRQIMETVQRHRRCGRKQAKAESLRLLEMVGIHHVLRRFGQYPFELSGGMQQRVAIAIALACEPQLLIADEPTTALDATVQRQILDLLKRIAAETEMAIIMVTHDLSAAAVFCDRILVMKDGGIVEEGDVRSIFTEPKHEYTQALVGYAKALQQSSPSHSAGKTLLRMDRVSQSYHLKNLLQADEKQEAVCDVSLEIKEGETVGIVGESGSGKTTLARMAAGLLEPSEGQIDCESEVQMIFQHNYSSFYPHFTVRQILAEPLVYRTGWPAAKHEEQIIKMLLRVGMTAADVAKYPHQLSGGEQQRIGIARALISEPQLIVCDEPVSSLDVQVQAQILELLKEVKAEQNLSYLFISHDLNVVRHISSRMGVMYLGMMAESGQTKEIYREPWHPYTKELLAATLVPDPRQARRKRRAPVKERLRHGGSGCPYYAYCGYALACCQTERPKTYRFGSREVACFLYSEEHSGRRSRDYTMTVQI